MLVAFNLLWGAIAVLALVIGIGSASEQTYLVEHGVAAAADLVKIEEHGGRSTSYYLTYKFQPTSVTGVLEAFPVTNTNVITFSNYLKYNTALPGTPVPVRYDPANPSNNHEFISGVRGPMRMFFESWGVVGAIVTILEIVLLWLSVRLFIGAARRARGRRADGPPIG